MKSHAPAGFACLLMLFFLCLASCRKEPEPVPVVESGVISDVTATTAVIRGRILELGGGIDEHGHCFGVTPGPDVGGDRTTIGSAEFPGPFTSSLEGLKPGTTYYVRAYAVSGGKAVYGKDVQLETSDGMPVVLTGAVSGIGVNSANCTGSVTSDGGDAVLSRGICWNTSQDFELSTAIAYAQGGDGLGDFQCNLMGLVPGTSYWVRAYAFNSVDTAHGSPVQFSTFTGVVAFQSVIVSGVSTNTAECNVIISGDGGSAITARGVCWANSPGPDLTDSYTSDGAGTGSYTSHVSGLSKETIYFLRPYAINVAGTYYGDEVTFTTLGTIPVSTLVVTAIRMNSASSGGFIPEAAAAAVTAKGVCWNTTGNPTIADQKTLDGSGGGIYTSQPSGLIKSTTYYLRAYATTNDDTYYGNQQIFTTDDGVIVLATAEADVITTGSATVSGDITDDGGSDILEKGICWNNAPDPLISDNRENLGSGPGSFSLSLTGLTANTVFYFRAYAINSEGVYYGPQKAFTTLE